MRHWQSSSGFTIVEVIVASSVLMAVWLAMARLLVLTTAANTGARAVMEATTLAVDKMEQLRALPFDDPAFAHSPPLALTTNVEGYYDVLDARYIRRWVIEPLASYPGAALSIQVYVVRTAGVGEARLATIKSRRVE